MIAAEYIN